MRRDPTEFRERFKRWKAGEKVYDAGTPISGYKEWKNRIKQYKGLDVDNDNTYSRKWKHPDGGPLVVDDYTYYGGNLPAVTVSAPALPAYQDQFTGQWYGIGPGGRKVNKPANFDPSGARVYTSPEAFERARLNRAYADDLNHFGEFSDMVRKGATALTLAPMTGPLLEGATAAGDAVYTGYKTLPWMSQQLIGKGSTALFGAQGLSNFFGPEGYKKTSQALREGRWGDAAISAVGDILDVSMALPVVSALGNTRAAIQSAVDDAQTINKNSKWLIKQFNGRHSTSRLDELRNKTYGIQYLNGSDAEAVPSSRRAFDKYIDAKNKYHTFRDDYRPVIDRGPSLEPYEVREQRTRNGALLPKYLRREVRNSETVDYRNMTQQQKEAYIEKVRSLYYDDSEYLRPEFINSTTNEYKITVPKSKFDPTRNNIVKTGSIEVRDARTGVTHSYKLNPEELMSGEVADYIYSPQTNTIATNTRQTVGSAIYPTAPKEYIDALNSNIEFATQEAVPGSKVFGSSASVTSGNLFHATDDIDLIMTESQARRHPKFKEWQLETNGQTYAYNHPTAGKLDVNILREDKNGLAVGPRAHELYFQLHPKEYLQFMKKAVTKGKLPDTNLVLDKTSKELLDSYDPLTKTMADAFFSSKPKHQGRALYFLHYGDVDDTRRAFEMYANSFMGGEYKPSNIPLSEFNNPEVNKALLEKIGDLGPINQSQFINDPKRMKLLFDYLVFDKTFAGRGVTVNSSKDLVSSLTKWDTSGQGGTAMGVGLNTVLGGNSGQGTIYATITPQRMRPLTGTTPSEVISEMTHNIGYFDLSDSEKNIVKEIARRNGVELPRSFDNLPEVLNSTAGKAGDNYQKMLEELAEAFDIPVITSGWYSGSPYASILESGNFSTDIKSLIPFGIDRPVGHAARARSIPIINFGAGRAENALDGLRNYSKYKLYRRDRKADSEIAQYMYPGRVSYYNSMLDRLQENKIKARQNWLSEVEQAQKIAKNRYKMLNEAYANHTALIQSVKSLLNATAICGGVGTALVGALKVLSDVGERRRKQRKESEEKL